VELFRSMDIPVRQLECCSGDLADLKVKSCDIEAWSPRQQKYFEVCSCSNLGDAQARRLKHPRQGRGRQDVPAHTLNNTCVAPPRMLIAFLENHLQADGTVTIPEVLQQYMGGTVGVVIGGAFTAIVTAVVKDIVNPLVSLLTGGIRFLQPSPLGIFPIGDLIMAIIHFLLVALVVFLMVRAMFNRLQRKKEGGSSPRPPPPPRRSCCWPRSGTSCASRSK
jgi:large conductance mechanosensitive channel protein